MLKSAEEFSWMYEPDFTTVQPYEVDEDGKLSVIIKGKAGDAEVIHKYEAPLNEIYDFVNCPLVVSGGAGKTEDFFDILKIFKLDGLCLSSALHFKKTRISEIKKYLYKKKFPINLI